MYYFASDIHLGLPAGVDPAGREQLFVRWLAEVAQDAEAIFLVGDIFDFWYEYRHVVPKGFTRTLGKLSELTDRGIPIHFFGGNHDIWTFRYLHDECGITLHHAPYTSFELYGQRVIIGHGDVLGPRPAGQRILSGVFRNRLLRTLFSTLHPYWAMSLGHGWSQSNRASRPVSHQFRGEDEPIVRFAHHYQGSPCQFVCMWTHSLCRVVPASGGRENCLFGRMDRTSDIRSAKPGGIPIEKIPGRAYC